jgi:ABC-type branched-subunit amino acid transport system permease subunit
MSAYILSVLCMAGIYAILAMSYDLTFGFAGMFSIAHGAFFGIGAYAGALGMLGLHAPFPIALLIGGVMAGLVALVVAVPASRLEGDYLVVGSLAFAVICYDLMINLTDVTRGPMGLPGIPSPSLFGIAFDTPLLLLLVILLVLAIVAVISARVAFSPYGRILRALKDDPVALEASGKSVMRHKVEVLVLGAFLAGVAGTVYAAYVNFIDPESFVLRTSLVILVAAVLGGVGTLWGPCLGALFLWVVPEALRFVGIPSGIRGPLNEIVYGGLLLAVVFLRPQGLVGPRRLRSRVQGGAT